MRTSIISLMVILALCTTGQGRVKNITDGAGQTVGFIDEEGMRHELAAPGDTPAVVPIQPEDVAGSQQTSLVLPAAVVAPAVPVTIVEMTTWGSSSYTPGSGIGLLYTPDVYRLSNGTSWESGAGSYNILVRAFNRVEVVGDTVRYWLASGGTLLQHTDYNSGDHSAVGTLSAVGDMVIEAKTGSTTAVLHGQARVTANSPANYNDDRFNYYCVPVGAVVPFDVTYTIKGGKTWTSTTFAETFSYSAGGRVDFAHPISLPKAVSLVIGASSKILANTSTQLGATVTYDSGVSKNVVALVGWEAAPPSLASINATGVLTAGEPAGGSQDVTVRATFTEGDVTLQAEKTITIISDPSYGAGEGWLTNQCDVRHSGSVAMPVEPSVFTLKWQKKISSGALKPVAAADGKVFASSGTSVFGVDDRDGELMWSRSLSSRTAGHPAYMYGNVYVATGGHSEAYLHCLDGGTGAYVYKSKIESQWDDYYAPTVYEGKVYINAGYYGGMYSFDAFSGAQNWFRGLTQYDLWTPAVDARYAYAYLGSNTSGTPGRLSVIDRMTGQVVFTVQDAGWNWPGWSMNYATILGEQNDIIGVNGGRLISFDLTARTIGWQKKSQYSGQPAVFEGVIYAINNGGLEAVGEVDGAVLWSWRPPTGSLTGAVVATKTHILAKTGSAVYAVERLSGAQDWSYAASGHLAVGNETLYIAASNGTLTAISVPAYEPAKLESVEIVGPEEVVENNTVGYAARVHYTDGRVRDRTLLAAWDAEPSAIVAIDRGIVTVGELFVPQMSGRLTTTYTEGDVTVSAEKLITLKIGCTIPEFLLRNINGAVLIKQSVLADLSEAMMRERAVSQVLGQLAMRKDTPFWRKPVIILTQVDVSKALLSELQAGMKLRDSVSRLNDANDRLTREGR